MAGCVHSALQQPAIYSPLLRSDLITLLVLWCAQPFQPDKNPNIIKKIFAMPLIGGGKGVDLPAAYRL